MYRTFNIILISLLIVTSSVVNATNVYKWMDEKGNTHYGDRPNKTAEIISVKNNSKKDKNHHQRAKKQERLLEVFEEEREKNKTDKMLLAEQKEKRKRRCSEAKKNLEDYKSAGFLYRLDKNGERHVLEGDEYDQALANSQKAVTHWCG